MDVLECMQTRRSVKKYKDTPVAKELVEKIVQAGLEAPSGRNGQAPIILAVQNKALRDELSRLNAKAAGVPEGTDLFYNAPVVLVVLASKEWNTRVYDGSSTMENMQLAAHALGLGACWVHRAKETFELPEGKAILAKLGLNAEGYEGIGNCIVGYADEIPQEKPRKANRAYYID